MINSREPAKSGSSPCSPRMPAMHAFEPAIVLRPALASSNAGMLTKERIAEILAGPDRTAADIRGETHGVA